MISYVFDLIGSFKICFKGIVSRDLEVSVWCHSIDLKFQHLWSLFVCFLTLILTAWKFKKPFFVKMQISPGWLKQRIFKKSEVLHKKC
jgi:hypothetical protein